MRITILADNTVAARNARGEHGLAFSIESGENCLLFDTGQGLVLADNAHALNVDLDAVDTIVLSHGHYDHTGGLAEILHVTAGPVAVHVHPDAILPKYQQGEAGVRDIGIPAQSQEAVRSSRCPFAASRQSAEVAPGIWTTGEIPRLHPEEAIAEPFYRDREGRETDPLLDDQAQFMGTAEGTTVLVGCAHSGIINTLDYIQSLTDGKADFITLAGSGEPTLHTRFAEIIDFIHRPCQGVTLRRLLEGERQLRQEFHGQLWVEVFLLRGINSTAEDVRHIARLVREITPNRVQFNTSIRPPAEPIAKAVPSSRMEELASLFDPAAEVVADFSSHTRPSIVRANEKLILNLLRRRPCTAMQISGACNLHGNESAKYLGRLLRRGAIHATRTGDGEYYAATGRKEAAHADV